MAPTSSPGIRTEPLKARPSARHRKAFNGVPLIAALAATVFAAAGCSGTLVRSAAGSVTAHISLDDRTVHAGGIVRGEVVFQNPTSTMKVLLHGCKVDGLYGIGFRAAGGYLDHPAFSDVGCDKNLPDNELTAKPGSTTYHFQVKASYMECGQDPENQLPRSSEFWSPLCLRDGHGERDIMPPLPAGSYKVQFYPAAKWSGPKVKPAVLALTG